MQEPGKVATEFLKLYKVGEKCLTVLGDCVGK